MKNEKIYWPVLLGALYYYRQLEYNDRVDSDCYIKTDDSYSKIEGDSKLIGHTLREIEEAAFLVNGKTDIVIVRKFDNED